MRVRSVVDLEKGLSRKSESLGRSRQRGRKESTARTTGNAGETASEVVACPSTRTVMVETSALVLEREG